MGASDLLRSWPADDVRRLSRGFTLLAWAPGAVLLGLLPGVWLFALMSLFSPGASKLAVLIAVGAGCVGGAVCFAAGCLVLTDNVTARALAPPLTIPVLRVTGPIGAALGLFSPLLRSIGLRHEPVTTFLIMLLCQGVTLAALASMLRLCHAMEGRTILGKPQGARRWISWAALGVLAAIWIVWYWVDPVGRGRSWEVVGGEWGGRWALVFLLLYGLPLWRLSDAVAAEEIVAIYEQESP